MLGFPHPALTVFAVLLAKPQMLHSPMVTIGLTVICIGAIFVALRGERRRAQK